MDQRLGKSDKGSEVIKKPEQKKREEDTKLTKLIEEQKKLG